VRAHLCGERELREEIRSRARARRVSAQPSVAPELEPRHERRRGVLASRGRRKERRAPRGIRRRPSLGEREHLRKRARRCDRRERGLVERSVRTRSGGVRCAVRVAVRVESREVMLEQRREPAKDPCAEQPRFVAWPVERGVREARTHDGRDAQGRVELRVGREPRREHRVRRIGGEPPQQEILRGLEQELGLERAGRVARLSAQPRKEQSARGLDRVLGLREFRGRGRGLSARDGIERVARAKGNDARRIGGGRGAREPKEPLDPRRVGRRLRSADRAEVADGLALDRRPRHHLARRVRRRLCAHRAWFDGSRQRDRRTRSRSTRARHVAPPNATER
jgi:hypothetical protein